MKFCSTVLIMTLFVISCFKSEVYAGPIKTNMTDIGALTADYYQNVAGKLSGITGGNKGATFHKADFGSLNGTSTTSDASRDSATFMFTVENLTQFSGNNKYQYLFESGGSGNGIGIYYNDQNEIVFSQRTKDFINTVNIDATSLIGGSFDIVASISLDEGFMRLFVGDSLFEEKTLLDGSVDWSGNNGGAFGQTNSSLVSGNQTGRAFNNGQVSDFSYYHDVVVFVPEPTSLALIALIIIALAFRRIKNSL